MQRQQIEPAVHRVRHAPFQIENRLARTRGNGAVQHCSGRTVREPVLATS